MTSSDPLPSPTLFTLLTIWGAEEDVRSASERLSKAVQKFYGPLDTENWEPVLSAPPKDGPWPPGGMVLRQPIFVCKDWEKDKEEPDLRVGRIMKDVSSERIACIGWGAASAGHPSRRAFMMGYQGSFGFHLMMWVEKKMSLPSSPQKKDRQEWERLIMGIGEGTPRYKERMDSLLAPVHAFCQEEEMSRRLADTPPPVRGSSFRPGRV